MKDKILITLGATTGAIAGGVAAYFLTPYRGKELQQKIIKTGNQLGQEGIKLTQKTLKTFEDSLIKMGPLNDKTYQPAHMKFNYQEVYTGNDSKIKIEADK